MTKYRASGGRDNRYAYRIGSDHLAEGRYSDSRLKSLRPATQNYVLTTMLGFI
jgi:hypothetical protein